MERNPALVGRGSGTTHQFEQSWLLCGTTGSLGLTIADLSDVASEASAKPLLQEAKSEPQSFLPPGLKPWADSFCPFVASSVRAMDSFSPFTFHLSRSLANPRAH